MVKNILIFADGTGNEGGLLPDESRTNVYKLYRATRTGPDSPIDPREQIAFYVRGVGTPGASYLPLYRKLWKGVESAVGGGLTSQITDCYAAIISEWKPGDRIYLFGFSRGAYAARCVAHVLQLAGIPTQEANGTAINFEPRALHSLARAGVKTLYRFGMPKRNIAERERNAAEFRAMHSCHTGAGISATPFFIGVWDSVAAVGWHHLALLKLFQFLSFATDKYDEHFVSEIPFARHAMAIDEYRRDFERVPWGGSKTVPEGEDIDGVTRFGQVWFAGNHSDIGGGYPENESRLSDITLDWMTRFITEELPDPTTRVRINRDILYRFPSSAGMMHDELMVGHTRLNLHIWPAGKRMVDSNGELHPTVLDRLALPEVRITSAWLRIGLIR